MSLVELAQHTDKNTTHSYLPLYDTLLQPIKETATNILEIGLHVGRSIKLWHDYFTKGVVYGCDCEDHMGLEELRNNDKAVLHLNDGAYKEKYVKERFGGKEFGFLLDDGPHTLESQEKFIKLYSSLLSDSGILIIASCSDYTHQVWTRKEVT